MKYHKKQDMFDFVIGKWVPEFQIKNVNMFCFSK